MPRTTVGKIGFLWVAAVINDFDQLRDIRIGFTAEHALRRTLKVHGR
jgi:hypothetical protein